MSPERYALYQERRLRVLRMVKAGLPVLKIARSLEISPQAVYKHIADLRREGLLPPDAA